MQTPHHWHTEPDHTVSQGKRGRVPLRWNPGLTAISSTSSNTDKISVIPKHGRLHTSQPLPDATFLLTVGQQGHACATLHHLWHSFHSFYSEVGNYSSQIGSARMKTVDGSATPTCDQWVTAMSSYCVSSSSALCFLLPQLLIIQKWH